MHEREIKLGRLENAILEPEHVETDSLDPELIHHLKRISEHGNRVLRVVLNRTVDPVRVVTVYFDRGMKGKL